MIIWLDMEMGGSSRANREHTLKLGWINCSGETMVRTLFEEEKSMLRVKAGERGAVIRVRRAE